MTHLVLDKMYVRTVDGMLFNITGYEHPTDSYYASLKYVNGQKWTDGYRAAMEWLSRHHPEYINNYVAVPRRQICEVFDPRERWLELTGRVEQQEAGQLHREAIQLGNKLANHLRKSGRSPMLTSPSNSPSTVVRLQSRDAEEST